MQTAALVRGKFTDSDEWSASIADWNLQFRQIECGPLKATVDRAMFPNLAIQRVQLSRRFHQCGFAPDGVLTFGIPDERDKISWYGKSAQRESMMNFNRRNGFEAVSEAGFSAHTISLGSDEFQRDAAALGLPELADQVRDAAEQFSVNSKDISKIRVVAQGLVSVLEKDQVAGTTAVELQDDLTHMLVRAVGNPDALVVKSNYSQRQRAVDRALELIATMESVTTLRQVYEYSGVSYRTLNRAFKERFGIGPKQYIVATRLAGVRRAITVSPPDTRITDIASDWGFWHLGRFAADYKRMFGELPSDTLKSESQRNGF